MVARDGRAPAWGDTGAKETDIFQECMEDGFMGDPMRGEGGAVAGNRGRYRNRWRNFG